MGGYGRPELDRGPRRNMGREGGGDNVRAPAARTATGTKTRKHPVVTLNNGPPPPTTIVTPSLSKMMWWSSTGRKWIWMGAWK